MAIVSISKAAKLVGKSRTTVQKYIKEGKLSKCADAHGTQGIDTSELIRVFGALIGHGNQLQTAAHNGQQLAVDKTDVNSNKIIELGVKLEKIKAILEEKEKLIAAQQKHIESLDNAMLLLENRTTKRDGGSGFFSRFFKPDFNK